MIELTQITKKFDDLQVLKGIDLSIDQSEVVSIVGPSGAGKTTLLHIMGTLDAPTSGTVNIAGTDVSRLSSNLLSQFRNRYIGFVFQFHQLLPEFTALENIMIPGMIALGQGTSKAFQQKPLPFTNGRTLKDYALDLLDTMNLADRASHKPNQLSGGERQRIAVARALINNPSVILADEPSGSLDTQNKVELHQLFFDLRDRFGYTFAIVTHDETLASMTDRTIRLLDGMVEETPAPSPGFSDYII